MFVRSKPCNYWCTKTRSDFIEFYNTKRVSKHFIFFIFPYSFMIFYDFCRNSSSRWSHETSKNKHPIIIFLGYFSYVNINLPTGIYRNRILATTSYSWSGTGDTKCTDISICILWEFTPTLPDLSDPSGPFIILLIKRKEERMSMFSILLSLPSINFWRENRIISLSR